MPVLLKSAAHFGWMEPSRQAEDEASSPYCLPPPAAPSHMSDRRTKAMPRIVGIDHLVLSVGDFARSKEFYGKLLDFLGFKLKHEYDDMAGWSNGETLFWIAAADAEGKKRKYRKGDIGFHHYAFELASRKDVDALGSFLEKNDMTVVDPPGEYYGRNYYAVYFTDPDGMKLEGMIWAPPEKKTGSRAKPKARGETRKKAKA
jgi:catechol 2,3-dioxygenase-like lactoylglutathione lyase family enzyme